MVLAPTLNAFVVLHYLAVDGWIEGRVQALNATPEQFLLTVVTGPKHTDACPIPPWKLIHCHHQPLAETVRVDGVHVKFHAADDSRAWRLTREAIARAMMGPIPEDHA